MTRAVGKGNDSGKAAGNPLASGDDSITLEHIESQEPREAPAIKKPYKQPSFRFERVFEVTALSCGKVGDSQLSCHVNRKVS
jgi:hypothetical protein